MELIRHPPPAAPGQLIVTPHLLLLDGQRIQTWHAAPGQSLAALLAAHAPDALDAHPPWQVCIGGVPVARAHWPHVFPKPGQVIEVRGAVGRAALAVVAVVALTYFTFGLGTYAGMAGAIGGIGGMAAAGATFMAGSALINKVLGPARPRIGTHPPEPVFALAGARNRLRPYEPLPLLFGRVRIAPDLLGKPYTWYEGREQMLGLVLCPGINVNRIEALSNGQTPLSSYTGVTIAHAGYTGLPDQPLPLHSNVDTIDGGELDGDGNWITRTTPPDTVRFSVNLDYVLGDVNSKGKPKSNHETIDVQYRRTGTSN